MATDSHPPELDQEEAKESLYLDLDENTCDDHVEVNIAIVGKAGCGRSSFVYSMLGYSTVFCTA
jgi:predicted GTPase